MPIGGPSVAPSARTWLGAARELTAGAALLPTSTIPVDAKSFTPEDMPKFLPDEAIRGSMAQLYNSILGPEDASFSFGGAAFLDTHGMFLDNTFGDLSTTGSAPANGTTLNAALPVGGTTAVLVTAGAGYTSGQAVQIDSGGVSEVVVLSAAAAGSAITFTNNPLRFPHAAGATVSTVSGPYTHKFALLNSSLGYGGVPGAQPPTLSLTDSTGLNYAGSPGTNTSGARTYPGACVSQFDFTGGSEALLDVKVSGNSMVSAPASAAPVPVASSVVPMAAWRSQVYIGGTAVANQVTTVGEWDLSVKRQLQPYFTVQGSQNPFVIARGPLSATMTLKFTTPADETALSYMLYQGYQWIHVAMTNGLSGANALSMTIDAHACQAVKAKPDRGSALFGFDTEWNLHGNSTDAGGSGGQGPLTITLVNNVPTY